ncbi:MAG: hypothetical protein ACOVPA_02720 [Rubrivivax sp.]
MNNTNIVRCKLSEIRVDGGTQPRAGLSESTVREYAEAMMAGDEFPKMVCFWDGASRFLASGFHRYFAHQAAGSVEVEVEQRTGTRRDALLYAVGTNYDHGLRLTNDDKRKAVRLLLEDEEWGQWTDRRIASETNTSHPFVAKVRAELAAQVETLPLAGATPQVETVTTTPAARKYVKKDGTEGTTTANIGKTKPTVATARDKPTSGPVTKTEPAADPADIDRPSAGDLLDEMQTDLRRAESRVAELEKALTADGKAAVVNLSQRLEHAERRQGELQEDAAKLKQARDFYERQLARCGKAVGQRDLDKVAPAVEAFVRAHSKAAA